MNKAQCLKDAADIEAQAEQGKVAYILLGQTAQYEALMFKAANLRQAAEMKAFDRKEFLKNN